MISNLVQSDLISSNLITFIQGWREGSGESFDILFVWGFGELGYHNNLAIETSAERTNLSVTGTGSRIEFTFHEPILILIDTSQS
jgi:hypothetical protein